MVFARKIWRLLVAIKDGLVLLLLLLFFAALYAALSFRPAPGAVREGALLVALDGVLVEQPQAFDPFAALLTGAAPIREYAARDVVRAIEGAARDDAVKAVVLDLDYFLGGGQVHISRIGEALDAVRAAGKPVLAHAIFYSDDSFQLAAHADELWLDPMGAALVAGPGGSQLYYGDVLDRLRVNVHVYRVGTYKSAVEPFERSSASAEAKEARRALYDSIWTAWRDEVVRARPQADINRVVTRPAALFAEAGDPARAALLARMVDRLGDREAFGARVAEITGEDDLRPGIPGSYAHTPFETWLDANPRGEGGRAIGVITVAGPIIDGEAGPGAAAGETIAELLNEALDDDLAALVVRIDSPGGSALASERIRNAILRHRQKGRPVVISMANYAASGGYWVATAGDTIFAEPATITGSIGVFTVVPTFEDTLAGWGIATDGVRTTPLSGQPDLLGGFTPEMEAVLQIGTESVYEQFLRLVARARNMPVARVAEIAEGRVWAGGTARQLGLVDRLGDFDAAAAFAASEAGLGEGDWHLREIAPQVSELEQLVEDLMHGANGVGEARAGAMPGLIANARRALIAGLGADLHVLTAGQSAGGVQAYCLECPARSAGGGSRAEPGFRAMLGRLFGID